MELPGRHRKRGERPREHRGWAVVLLALGGGVLATQYSRVPQASVAPRLDFAAQSIGSTSAQQSVAIDNTGHAPLNIQALALAGSHPQDFLLDTNDCTQAAIDPGRSCAVAVRFRPLVAGVRMAVLSVANDARDSPQSIAFTGTGLDAPVPDVDLGPGGGSPAPRQGGRGKSVLPTRSIAVDPERVDFEPQQLYTGSPMRVLVLANTRAVPLTIGQLAIEGSYPMDFVSGGDGCSRRTLVSQMRCAIEVRFAPTGAGPRSAELVVPSDASAAPVRVPLSGLGRETPPLRALAIYPPVVEFPPQTLRSRGLPREITFRNTGSAPVRVGNNAIRQPGQEFKIGDDSCSKRLLQPTDSCTIAVWFVPREAREHGARLLVEHDAPDSPREVALRGTALISSSPPEVKSLEIVPASIQFKARTAVVRRVTVVVAREELELRSTGAAPVKIGGISIAGGGAADFRLDDSNGCAHKPVRRETPCRIAVLFVPAGSGVRQAVLRVEHDAPAGPREVPLSGTGWEEPASCPDPAVSLRPVVVLRRSPYAGTIRLTGAVRNVGAAPYRSTPGRQSLTLYQVMPGGQQQPVKVLSFTNLAPGEELPLVHDIEWSTSDEFPPSFLLRVVYDPGLHLDCGSGNNVAILSPQEISQLVRAQAEARPTFKTEPSVNLPGGDYRSLAVSGGPEECEKVCAAEPNCSAFTWVKSGVQGARAVCWLKSSVPPAVDDPNCVSGYKEMKPAQLQPIRRKVQPLKKIGP